MATIGTFTAQGDGYTGSIKTLTLNVKAAVLRPNEKSDDKAPDFRIFAGQGATADLRGEAAPFVRPAVVPDKPGYGLDAGSDTQRPAGEQDMVVDRAGGEAEATSDLAGRKALGGEAQAI